MGAAAALTACAITAAPSPAGADAAPTTTEDSGDGARLSGDFRIIAGPEGSMLLVWSGAPVRMGGARPEFRLGDEVIGYPREARDRLELEVSPTDVARVEAYAGELQVWSAGRRLDAPEPRSRTRRPERAVPGGTVVDTDPAAPGRWRTERRTYRLDPVPIDGLSQPSEMLAEVTRPVGNTGRMPLVVFLHGRTVACYTPLTPDPEAPPAPAEYPCPEGSTFVPSYQGYRYVADVLASQGYLVVSISANAINRLDAEAEDGGASARSQLVRRHLDLWAEWNGRGGDPWGGAMRGRVDLSNVVLVGHSRGGEGVNRAAIDASSSDPYRIVGLVSYAPTALGTQVTPDINSATLLGTCDGDVFDLQGQMYVDASRDIADSPALRSAVVVIGANHNYFNTEWTPGLSTTEGSDDWFDPDDPVCGTNGSERLTSEEQRKVAAAYTLALVRLSVRADREMLPLLDGSGAVPRAIGRAKTAVNLVGGDATLLYRPVDAGGPVLTGGMAGGECSAPFSPAAPVACTGDWPEGATPHWTGLDGPPVPGALELSWTAPGSVARFDLPTGVQDLRKTDALRVRVANDPGLDPAQLSIRIRDARGRVATLRTNVPAVDGWPGSGQLARVQARTLRADLSRAKDVDLRRIVAIELVGGPVTAAGTARVFVFDVAAARDRVPRPTPLDLPRISANTTSVVEGNGEPVSAEFTIRRDDATTTPTTVWLQLGNAAGVRDGRLVTIPAGPPGLALTLPATVIGDTWYRPPALGGTNSLGMVITAVRGAVTGDYQGGVTTIEDDPVPTLSVDQAEVSTTEGNTLTWTLRLSGPTNGTSYLFEVTPPPGTQLDTEDIDPTWLAENGLIGSPSPPQPLAPLWIQVDFLPGATEATIEIPILTDGRSEPDESTRLELVEPDETVPAGGLTLTGTVLANDT